VAPRVGDETIRSFPGLAGGDPLIGAVVDSYRVESVVGSGSMGIVYRAVHTVIGKPVAIKVLKADFADDPDMVQRLVREARTVNAIRHPSIVDAFGFGTLPRTGQPYIVMDLLVGEPLDAYVQREAPVSLKVAGRLLDELLSALSAAHQVGVIHRDLKPGNCFLEAQPDGGTTLKLLDFGLARQADRAGGSVRPTNPGTLIGTPAFMAPEQVMGQKVGPAADLYAVGGMAYQLLTGHLPHEAPSAIEVLTQKMQFDPVRPRQWNPWVSEDVDAWVLSLLHREPEHRPKDADTARRSLRRLVEGRTMAESPAYRPSGPSGLRPTGGSSPSGLRSRNTPLPQRREWGESRTVLVESPPSERSTDAVQSPWAKTTAAMPAVDGQAEPTAREAPSPLASGPHASRSVVVDTLGDDATLVRPASASVPPPAPEAGPRRDRTPPVGTAGPNPVETPASSAPTARLHAPPVRVALESVSPREELRAPPPVEPTPPVQALPRGLVAVLAVTTLVLLVGLVLLARAL
jgi:serine/threonine-protein kinase